VNTVRSCAFVYPRVGVWVRFTWFHHSISVRNLIDFEALFLYGTIDHGTPPNVYVGVSAHHNLLWSPTRQVSATMAQPAVKAQDWDSLFTLAQEVPIAGRTALITGCSAGIGKATACALAAADCHLVLVARRQAKLDELAGEIKARKPSLSVTVVAGDVNDKALFDKLRELGIPERVDILVRAHAT
jgi:hypothetical protein